MGMGGGWLGLLLNLALFAGALILLGLAAVWFARQFGRAPSMAGGGPDPVEIARRRLAAGEITSPEFERIREQLRS